MFELKVFFSSLAGCLIKTKEPGLPYYLFITGWRTEGFMSFPKVLPQNETQNSSRIWTRVTDSISHNDNRNTKRASNRLSFVITEEIVPVRVPFTGKINLFEIINFCNFCILHNRRRSLLNHLWLQMNQQGLTCLKSKQRTSSSDSRKSHFF